MARAIRLATIVLVVLAAAVAVARADTPRRGGVFRVPVPEAPTLDPHQSAGFVPHLYASLVYSHLVRFPAGPEAQGSGDQRILPDLAEKWEFTTLERFRAKSPLRDRLETVQAIDVVDRHTVRIVLREPFAPLLNHLASPAHCVILPREIEEKFKDLNQPEAVIGTGPFVLKSYQRGVRAVYERNPDYFMPGLPYLDTVHLEGVPEQNTRLSMLRAGKLELAHWWGWLTPDEGSVLKKTNPELTVTKHVIVDMPHIWMRTDQPPFNDVRVRRAVSLAIDRNAWREALLSGEGCLDAGPVPCAMTEWKLPADKLPPAARKYLDGYDPVEAKRLLAEAGLGRGFTTPIFHWLGYAPPWRSFYELAAENLGRVGITAELKPEEYGKFSSTTALGKFEKMAMGPFGAADTEVDAFLLRAVLQRYLADKAYYIYLPMWPRFIAHPAYVKGFKQIIGQSLGSRLTHVWLER